MARNFRGAALVASACLVLAACSGAARPDAAFERLREAARRADLGMVRGLLTAAERDRMDRELPDLATAAGREAALAAHGGELAVLVRCLPVGWTGTGGGRAEVRIGGAAGPERVLALARENGEWRFADVAQILRFDPERRARLDRLRRIGAGLRELARAGRLPGVPGAAFLAAALPEADRGLAAGFLGPSTALLAKLAAGETPLVVAADGAAPGLPDGICVLYEDGRPEFLPYPLLAGFAGGPVRAGPDSPDPRLASLVDTE